MHFVGRLVVNIQTMILTETDYITRSPSKIIFLQKYSVITFTNAKIILQLHLGLTVIVLEVRLKATTVNPY